MEDITKNPGQIIEEKFKKLFNSKYTIKDGDSVCEVEKNLVQTFEKNNFIACIFTERFNIKALKDDGTWNYIVVVNVENNKYGETEHDDDAKEIIEQSEETHGKLETRPSITYSEIIDLKSDTRNSNKVHVTIKMVDGSVKTETIKIDPDSDFNSKTEDSDQKW